MQFDVNYAWSHSLGVQPNNSWTGAFNMFTMRNLRDSYGPTGFDYRHVIHANGTYDLPFGKGKRFASNSGVADKVIGGWSVGTIANWQTGGPYQLLGGFNTSMAQATLRWVMCTEMAAWFLTELRLSDLQASQGAPCCGCSLRPHDQPEILQLRSEHRLAHWCQPGLHCTQHDPGCFRSAPVAVWAAYLQPGSGDHEDFPDSRESSGSSSRVSSSTYGTTQSGRTRLAATTAPARGSSRTPRRPSRVDIR